MQFKWEQFLEVANELNSYIDNSQDASEAYCRSSMNRAYYACFHIAKRKVILPSERDANQHASVKNQLLNHQNQKINKLGFHFQRLQKFRETADYYERYKSETNNIKDDTRMALNFAKMIIEEINSE